MYRTLKKEMEVKGYTFKTLKNKTGHSEAVLCKFLSNEDSVKFNIVLDTIRSLAPEQECKLIAKFCHTKDDKKPETIKNLLEYCATHRMYDELRSLIDVCINHQNKVLRQWGRLYEVLIDWKEGLSSKYESLVSIKGLKITCPTLDVFAKLLEINILIAMKNFNFVDEMISVVSRYIDKVKDVHLKQSFSVRLNELQGVLALRIKKDKHQSRQYAEYVAKQDIGAMFTAYANYLLGMTYMFESIDKMNHYFNKSLSLYNIYYNKDDFAKVKNRIDKLNDILLNKVDATYEYTPGANDPIDLHIEGLKQNSDHHLMACMSKFIKQGDNFMAEISKKELEARGVDLALLNQMY